MKKEEIAICKIYLDDLDKTHDCNEYKLLMKLLDKEPCEDCVSRNAIDQNIYDYAESNGLSYANMKNYILDAPSVTPTHKKGKWIKGCTAITGDGLAQTYDCSECGSYWYKKFNYCPNCGAEMEMEE